MKDWLAAIIVGGSIWALFLLWAWIWCVWLGWGDMTSMGWIGALWFCVRGARSEVELMERPLR